MRHTRGKFARGGAIAGATLVGLIAANAFAADGTLKAEQGLQWFDEPGGPFIPARSAFNGDIGGGEFGIYDFVNNNVSLGSPLPMAATAKVNNIVNGHGPFLFQSFCLEPGVPFAFNQDVTWTASNTVELPVGTRNLDPRTAYLFFKFYTDQGFSPAYVYTVLPGNTRKPSARDLQAALWFTEGVWGPFNTLPANSQSYVTDANTAVAPGGSWFALWGGTFPGNLGGVKALNIRTAGDAREQDILAIFVQEPPPPPPDGDCEGRTPGFWHNKNGLKLIKNSGGGVQYSWINTLNALCLRKANGSDADFTANAAGADDLSDYLVSGNNAVNMAQKLSQHVAAMQLNLLNGFADEDCLVFTGQNADCIPGSPDTVSIGDVMDLAKDQLCDHALTTVENDPVNRAIQECLKNILDAANNNTNWVH